MSGRDRTPPRAILPEHRIDEVAAAVIALTREVWVLQDRQAVMERIMEDAGIPADAIDRFEPDAEMQVIFEKRRTALLANVLGALSGGEIEA